MHYVQTAVGVAGQAFDGKCRSYDPGHAPHYIQLRKAFESGRTPATFVGIELPNTVLLSIGGVVRQFFNHHPDTIQDLIKIHSGGQLAWFEDFRVLALETNGPEGFVFSLAAKPINPCLP